MPMVSLPFGYHCTINKRMYCLKKYKLKYLKGSKGPEQLQELTLFPKVLQIWPNEVNCWIEKSKSSLISVKICKMCGKISDVWLRYDFFSLQNAE